MSKFARLITLENNEQVLLTLDYNDENDISEVKNEDGITGFQFQIAGVNPDLLEGLKEIVSNATVEVAYNKDGFPIAMYDSHGNPIKWKIKENE